MEAENVSKYPQDPRLDYVKRFVGLPRDKLTFHNNRLNIYRSCDENQTLQDNYCEVSLVNLSKADVKEVDPVSEGFLPPNTSMYFEQIDNIKYRILISRHSRAQSPQEFIVPEGHLFVLGDYRDNSHDSRYWGFVPMENVKGVVLN